MTWALKTAKDRFSSWLFCLLAVLPLVNFSTSLCVNHPQNTLIASYEPILCVFYYFFPWSCTVCSPHSSCRDILKCESNHVCVPGYHHAQCFLHFQFPPLDRSFARCLHASRPHLIQTSAQMSPPQRVLPDPPFPLFTISLLFLIFPHATYHYLKLCPN